MSWGLGLETMHAKVHFKVELRRFYEKNRYRGDLPVVGVGFLQNSVLVNDMLNTLNVGHIR
jgi:hypothetical protein